MRQSALRLGIAIGLAMGFFGGIVGASAQEPPHKHASGARSLDGLGTVAFPNSGAAAAQPAFLRGLALLHSFEYVDAGEAFREAQRADPGFAMAYWAEALTFARLLWGLDHAAEARACLSRLGADASARLRRAGTERERGYGAAVEALFGSGDLSARGRAYADSVRALAARYPDDLEATALASIALQISGIVGGHGPDQRRALRDEAITLAQSVFDRQPDHPGGAHYLIHATDSPEMASRGLSAATAFAKIAPDAEHALHMPSHIFLQLGLWDDVVSSNERAWQASRSWVARRKSSGDHLDFHALQWLQYGYLQQGRHRAARALVDTARMVLIGADFDRNNAIDARYATSILEFAYATETGDWSVWHQGERPAAPKDTSLQRARAFAAYSDYRVAYAAAVRGDTAITKALARRFGGSGWRAVAQSQLGAVEARRRGDIEASIVLLREAAVVEAGIPHAGPPWLVPSHELLAARLLEAGRPADAVQAYQQALALMPKRTQALIGLARAHTAAGDRGAAENASAQLRANLNHADPGVAGKLRP